MFGIIEVVLFVFRCLDSHFALNNMGYVFLLLLLNIPLILFVHTWIGSVLLFDVKAKILLYFFCDSSITVKHV